MSCQLAGLVSEGAVPCPPDKAPGRLQLREIAPEYYNTLSYHTSWTWVTWKFLTDPEVGPWTRMRRLSKGHAAAPGEAAVVASTAKAAGLDTEVVDLGYGIPLRETRDAGLRSRAAAAALIS